MLPYTLGCTLKKPVSRLAGGLTFILLALPAAAGIVYQQPPAWAGNQTGVGSVWTSHVDAGGNGWRAYDSFALGSGATINQASWYGVYLNVNLANGSPNTTSWSVQFLADNAGTPGAVLSNQAPAVTSSLVGTGFFGGNAVDVYEFQADLSGFAAAAGTTYWFSPHSTGPTFYDLMGWIQGTGGPGGTFQQSLAGGSVTQSFVRSADRAFALSAVPEPSTWTMLGVGAGALVFLRRRRS